VIYVVEILAITNNTCVDLSLLMVLLRAGIVGLGSWYGLEI